MWLIKEIRNWKTEKLEAFEVGYYEQISEQYLTQRDGENVHAYQSRTQWYCFLSFPINVIGSKPPMSEDVARAVAINHCSVLNGGTIQQVAGVLR